MTRFRLRRDPTGKMSSGSLSTVLALCSTAISTSTHHLLFVSLSESTLTSTIPDAALRIFCAYAIDHPAEIAHSDVLGPVLIDIHHLLFLLPAPVDGKGVSVVVEKCWNRTKDLSAQEQAGLADQIEKKLATMLLDINCSIRQVMPGLSFAIPDI